MSVEEEAIIPDYGCDKLCPHDATVVAEERARRGTFLFNNLCALKADPGPCRALRDRFFFNVDTGRCEQFEYGGCRGNKNNFETLEACQKVCLVSDDKNPCDLPQVEGPCRALMPRFYFDSKSRQCKHFYYGGCFGNANNFFSMAACEEKCQRQGQHLVNKTVVQMNGTDSKSSPDVKQEDRCSSPIDRGTCDGSMRRFAYNPATRRCQEFTYSGCGGNNNNFKHRRQCFRKCVKNQKDGGMKMIRIRKKNIPKILLDSV
nr:tissue factor pathway inhibitor-like [Nerophis lumbriciformis]